MSKYRTIAITSERIADEDVFNIGISMAENIECVDLLNAAHLLVQEVAKRADGKTTNDVLEIMKTLQDVGSEPTSPTEEK